MPLVVKDRVKETTTTTGTGTLTLAGAVTGFQAFSVIGDGNTTYYTITDGIDFEVGVGTYTLSGTTLSRDTILESSNSGSAVNFSAGSKEVFVTYPAERAIYTDAAGTEITPATSSRLGFANLAQGSALSVLGVTGNATADVASVAAGTDHQVLRRSGTSVGFGAVNLAQAAAVTGTLVVANGGTGAATLTANNVILGNGTSAVQFVDPGSNGNVLTSNGSTWVSAASSSGSGSAVRVFNSPATWTKPSGLQYIKVTVIGGGAGGTGVAKKITTPAPQATVETQGIGGGGGGAAISYISAPTIPGPVAVTVGSGGTGGVAPIPVVPFNSTIFFNSTAGNPGGTTSFGPFVSATGGPGPTSTSQPVPGCPPTTLTTMQGGIGSGGMFNYKASGSGQITPTSFVGFESSGGYYTTSPTVSRNGLNASGRTNALASPIIGGIGSFSAPTFTANTDGQNATTTGEGGSGGWVRTPQTARPGGAGFAGIVIVEEFYS